MKGWLYIAFALLYLLGVWWFLTLTLGTREDEDA